MKFLFRKIKGVILMSVIKLSEDLSFFGSSQSLQAVRDAVKENPGKYDTIDFEGVIVHKGTHGDIIKLLEEVKLKPVNLKKIDQDLIKQAETFDKNYVDFKSIEDRKSNIMSNFPAGSFAVLVATSQSKRAEKRSLAFIDSFSKRGPLCWVYYENELRGFKKGTNLLKNKSISRVEEISWEDLHIGNFYLRNLNKEEEKFVDTLKELSSDKKFKF